MFLCTYCDQRISHANDGAWEDSSGRSGCGCSPDCEHSPVSVMRSARNVKTGQYVRLDDAWSLVTSHAQNFHDGRMFFELDGNGDTSLTAQRAVKVAIDY